eukprot:6178388-Pleurochrysis_carterae.AAC.1
MYLSGDKHEELSKYLGKVFEKFNSYFSRSRTGMKDEKGFEEWRGEICLPCNDADGKAVIEDGGDAAAANAMAGLEPPPSKEGCCTYCEARRVDWFDLEKVKSAKRRNLERSFRSAHMVPPGAAPGIRLRCPHCSFIVSEETCAAAKLEFDNLSSSKQLEAERAHRRAHAGQILYRSKLLHNEHAARHLSLLHLLLNS